MKTQKTILNTLMLSFMVTAVAPAIAAQPEQQDSLAAIVKDFYSDHPKISIGIAAIATLCLYKLYKRMTRKTSLFKGRQFEIHNTTANQPEVRDTEIRQIEVRDTKIRQFLTEGQTILEACKKEGSQFAQAKKFGKNLYVTVTPKTQDQQARNTSIPSVLTSAGCSPKQRECLLKTIDETPSETLFMFKEV